MILTDLSPASAILVLAAAAGLVAWAPNSELTLDVAATTEIAEVAIDTSTLSWVVAGATASVDDGSERPFEGDLLPADGSRVEFRRSGRGTLTVDVEAEEGSTAGILKVANKIQHEAKRRVLLTFRDLAALDARGRRPVFAFRGRATIGEQLRSEQKRQAYMLEEGRLLLLGRTLFRKETYQAARHDLTNGDVVAAQVEQEGGLGFVAAGPDRGLRVGFRAIASTAEVRRYGTTDPLVISVPVPERLLVDRDRQMTVLVVGLLLSLLGVAAAWARRMKPAEGRPHVETSKAAATCLLIMAGALPCTAEIVMLKGAADAQGITMIDRGECLIVAPKHAFAESGEASVEVISLAGSRARARVFERYEADILRLRFLDRSNAFCREPWPTPRPGYDVAPAEVLIRTVKPGGILASMAARVERWGTDDLVVRLVGVQDSIMRGMSGSAIVNSDRILGMLLSVEDGRGIGLRISAIDKILGRGVVPTVPNLSGVWDLVVEVGGPMRGGRQTLVKIEHTGNVVKAWLHTPGPDLNEEDGWKARDKLLDGELEGTQGFFTGYGRARPSPGGSGAGSSASRHPVGFRVVDGDTIETELVEVDARRGTASTRRVTLHRVGQGAMLGTPSWFRPAAWQAVSGREAYNTLRRTFEKLGPQDLPSAVFPTPRYETRVRDGSKCTLVLEEVREEAPGRMNSPSTIETTTLDMAAVDVDEIKAFPADLADFPRASWFVEVPAAGPAIRVRKAWARGSDISRQVDSTPDRVTFFLRYQKMAQDVARALQIFGRACGAR